MAQDAIDNITLRDAVMRGVFSNPQYTVAREERLAAEQVLEQARAGFRPTVDANAETGYEYSNRLGINGVNRWRKEASVSLSQLLFDGFGTRNLVNQRRAGVTSQTQRLRETKELVGLDVVSAYLEVLRQRKQVGVARENIAQHQALLTTLEDAARAGTISTGDVEQARARLAASTADLYSVLQSLSDADAGFRRVLGLAAGELADAGDPRIVLPATVDEMVERALENSPTLGVLGADIKAATARRAAADAAFYPEFNFVVNGRRGDDVDGISGRNDEVSAQVVMSWNLYNGGADTARKSELNHRLNATRGRNDDARRAVEEDIRRTWAAMQNAKARAAQFGAQAAANEKVVAVYKDQFNLGRRTLLDVLDAQNELFITRLSHINAGYTALLAKYRLLALEGGLLEFLDINSMTPAPGKSAALMEPARLAVPSDAAGGEGDMPSARAEAPPAAKAEAPAAIKAEDTPKADAGAQDEAESGAE